MSIDKDGNEAARHRLTETAKNYKIQVPYDWDNDKGYPVSDRYNLREGYSSIVCRITVSGWRCDLPLANKLNKVFEASC